MNCQEAFNLLYDYIDREISEIDNKEVQEHLKKCSHCFDRFRLEESIQQLIDEKVKSSEASPKLDTLKSNLLSKLDEIDKEIKTETTKLPFFKTSRILTIAASLVIFVGAAFLISDFYKHQEHFIPLEQAHWNTSENFTSFANATVTSKSMSDINDNFDCSLNEKVKGYELTGGKKEKIMGIDMTHFLYKNGESSVSVFVVCGKAFDIPEELNDEAIMVGGKQLFDHNCRGCRLVYHRTDKAIVVTATTDQNVDLLSFIPETGSI